MSCLDFLGLFLVAAADIVLFGEAMFCCLQKGSEGGLIIRVLHFYLPVVRETPATMGAFQQSYHFFQDLDSTEFRTPEFIC